MWFAANFQAKTCTKIEQFLLRLHLSTQFISRTHTSILGISWISSYKPNAFQVPPSSFIAHFTLVYFVYSGCFFLRAFFQQTKCDWWLASMWCKTNEIYIYTYHMNGYLKYYGIYIHICKGAPRFTNYPRIASLWCH